MHKQKMEAHKKACLGVKAHSTDEKQAIGQGPPTDQGPQTTHPPLPASTHLLGIGRAEERAVEADAAQLLGAILAREGQEHTLQQENRAAAPAQASRACVSKLRSNKPSG
jgi:hypothetical protein